MADCKCIFSLRLSRHPEVAVNSNREPQRVLAQTIEFGTRDAVVVQLVALCRMGRSVKGVRILAKNARKRQRREISSRRQPLTTTRHSSRQKISSLHVAALRTIVGIVRFTMKPGGALSPTIVPPRGPDNLVLRHLENARRRLIARNRQVLRHAR